MFIGQAVSETLTLEANQVQYVHIYELESQHIEQN